MHEYRGRVVKVVDGDTVDVAIDLGFRITIVQRCRLHGLNAPEMRGPTAAAGLAAKLYVETWLGCVGTSGNTSVDVIVHSHKPYADDKYGRWVVQLWKNVSTSAESLNTALIRTGHAVPYMVDG